MICSKKQRPAVAAAAATAKTARACDSCVCRRARWYCAEDDAFLCQSCDSSVHSANPLARRHRRVRLQSNPTSKLAPSWHNGFKRKARTPRPNSAKIGGGGTDLAFVPEIEASGEDGGNEEEQLLYRVPILDPVLAEFCSPPLADETANTEAKPIVNTKVTNSDTNFNSNHDQFLAGFLQSDAELAEFAADMESLLGRGHDNDSFSMEELGLVDAKYSPEESGQVKEEYLDNDAAIADDSLNEEIDLSRETPEINFDCRPGDDEEQEETITVATAPNEEYQEGKKIGLRLDYEAVAVQWSANGTPSPWVNGERPQLGPDNCWLDYMVMWGGGEVQGVVPGEMGGIHFDEGREARVSRYREKRRTRLFSKKIRYEVRKLNAEKRPRMKGRFVKRASFAAAAAPAAFKY